jgi:hypothetical protein
MLKHFIHVRPLHCSQRVRWRVEEKRRSRASCTQGEAALASTDALSLMSRLQAIGCLVRIRGPPPHPAFEFQTITEFDSLTAAAAGINDDMILRCCISLQVPPAASASAEKL